MITVTVKHHFSAGHRILGLGGEASKCANLHGHTFGVEAEFSQASAFSTDPFVEFTAVKKLLREWVDVHFDHGYIVADTDTVLRDFLESQQLKHFVTIGPPTTESIAQAIGDAMQQALPVRKVMVTEGPHNAATWYQ